MVERALDQLDLNGIDWLMIENVGNLVCPAAYDLGEDLRLVMLSVTEGEDKPLKYPATFHSADVVVISKIDLAEACQFDLPHARRHIARVAPKARIVEVSARSGAGMEDLQGAIETALLEAAAAPFPSNGRAGRSELVPLG
jgi:hydrogenase nickel incorporation protein HypB